LIYYFYHKDQVGRKSKRLLIKIFLLGIIYTLPVYGLEQIVSLINQQFKGSQILFYLFESFVVAGLCEEYIKLRIVKKYAYPTDHFRQVYDGIMYTVTASLGFACMENIVYVINGTLSTALNRGFTAVPMHAISSGMMGYYIGRARFASTTKDEHVFMATGLWIAIFIHGIYDLLVMIAPLYGSIFSSIAIAFVAIVFLRLRTRINQTLND